MAGQVFQGAESFLGHSGSSSSGGFLKNWKDEGEIDVILHPRGAIAALWAHRWMRIDKDKEDKPKIFPMRFNSMEDEKILKRQHFRLGDGTREHPPVICPFSLLLEWVREAIEVGDIDWTDEIFKFETPRDDAVIHAGGFTGLFQKKDLKDEQYEELKKAKINRKEAYKENGSCKLNYCFVVLQYNLPEEGAMIAMEGKALGQKMQKAMRDEARKWEKTKTPSKGDPFKEPFAFRWTYDENENFDDAYDVLVMPPESKPIEPAHLLAFEDDPPSLEKIIEPSNVALLRLSFEEHWTHRITPPWDELFAKAEARVKGTPAAELPKEPSHTPDDAPSRTSTGSGAKTKAQEVVADVEEVECDVCKKGMPETVFTCPHCGAEYDPTTGKLIETKPEPPKEEKPRRSRSAAKSDDKQPGPADKPGSATKEDVDAEAPKRRRGG